MDNILPKCTACGYNNDQKVTHSYRIVVDVKTPSQNDLKANTRYAHKYRGLRRKFVALFGEYASVIPGAVGHRRVFFTRFYGKGKRDYDYGNLVGGLKPALDALTLNKFLIDDSPKWCSDYYQQFKSPDGRDHLVVVLEDIEHDEK